EATIRPGPSGRPRAPDPATGPPRRGAGTQDAVRRHERQAPTRRAQPRTNLLQTSRESCSGYPRREPSTPPTRRALGECPTRPIWLGWRAERPPTEGIAMGVSLAKGGNVSL